MLSLEEGKKLVKIARTAIEKYIVGGKEIKIKDIKDKGIDVPNSFLEKRGVFVTLRSYPSNDLRGCIGLPLPEKELILATIDAAISSATNDPRFGPVSKEEINKISVEISVLTKPERIKVKDPKEYVDKIEIGKDGLIIKYGFYSGLLLPQVPIEQDWNEEEYLNGLCQKAGLAPDMWMEKSIEIYKFQAQIFEEEKPDGEIIERKLKQF